MMMLAVMGGCATLSVSLCRVCDDALRTMTEITKAAECTTESNSCK